MSFILTLPVKTFGLNIVDKVQDVKSDVGSGIKLNLMGNNKDTGGSDKGVASSVIDIYDSNKVDKLVIPFNKLSLNITNHSSNGIDKKTVADNSKISLIVKSSDTKDVKSGIVLNIGGKSEYSIIDNKSSSKGKIICPEKWRLFAESLPVGSDGHVDNKILREKSKSNWKSVV